jgi:hypothetical protein|tara:strand:+ start:365 stop:664 length:300 start_codon:yes stop_codon:yes gene_type:complete
MSSSYMSKTKFAIRLIEIWNSSETRQGAYTEAQLEFGNELTYSQMMNKIAYARRQGVDVRDLEWDTTNWSAVKSHFHEVQHTPEESTQINSDDSFEIEE